MTSLDPITARVPRGTPVEPVSEPGRPPEWRAEATARLERVVAEGDNMGDLANMTGDELRDVLKLAAERIRDVAPVWRPVDPPIESEVLDMALEAVRDGLTFQSSCWPGVAVGFARRILEEQAAAEQYERDIRREERHRLAKMLEENGTMLNQYVAESSPIELIAFLLRLDHA